MKLSIVICLYNTEKSLLSECLDSLRRAVLPPIDHEIIIVDDGSDGDYSDIARRYGAIYEKQRKRGTLAARLRGIELASGEYIAFVDSDDTVGFNYYAPMIKRADEGFDIVFNSWAFRTERTRYVCVLDDAVSGNITSDKPIDTLLYREGEQHSYYVLWNKIYKSEPLKRAAEEIAELGAPRDFCFSEDTLINLFAFLIARRVGSVRTGYYYYRLHAGQTVNATSKEKLLCQVDLMSYTLEKYREAVAENDVLTKKVRAWRDMMVRGHVSRARQGGYGDAIPYIMKRYGASELHDSMRLGGEIYEKVRLLPKNAEEIEIALWKICRHGDTVKVRRPKRRGYAELLLDSLTFCGRTVEYGRDYAPLPREKISLVKRLVFSAPLRRLAGRLFKKGSRIRAFLKRFI